MPPRRRPHPPIGTIPRLHRDPADRPQGHVLRESWKRVIRIQQAEGLTARLVARNASSRTSG